jgi:hypothetical protein
VTLPFVSRIPALALMVGHIGIGLAGLIGIVVSGTKLNKAYDCQENGPKPRGSVS